MKCPNVNDKRVRAVFNDCVVALGGKPLTIPEFTDYKLQQKRSGVDKSSIYTVYGIFDSINDTDSFINSIESFNGDQSKILGYINKFSENELSVRSVSNNHYLPGSIPGKINEDSDYSETISYIDFLLSLSIDDSYLSIHNKMIIDLEDHNSDISKRLSLSGVNSDSRIQSVLNIISEIYNDNKKISLSDIMSNFDRSSIYNIIDGSVSVNTLKMFEDGSINLFDIIDHSKKSEFLKESISYITTSNLDVESEFSSIILKNADIIADNITKTTDKSSGVSNAGGISKNVHYTIDSNGIITINDKSIIKRVVDNSMSNSITFNLNGIDPDDIISISKDNGYKVIIDRDNGIFTIFKYNKEIDLFIQENTSKINQIAEFISKYYSNTHAKTRSSIPSAIKHLSQSVVDMTTVIDDSIKILEDIASEASFILNKSVKRNSDGSISGIESVNDFSSIKNSVYIHQLDVDLIPLAESIIAALSVDINSSGNQHLIKRFKKSSDNIAILRQDVNNISLFNYGNILRILKNKYNIDTDVINDLLSSRSEVKNRFLYAFKYLNKSNSPELKYISFLLSSISDEAKKDYRGYGKIQKLLDLSREIKGFKPFKFYEKDSKNKPTGYVKDRVRWGDFFEEYSRFEKYLLDKYGANGLYDFSVSADMLDEYKSDVNDWIRDNTCMPTGTKYFDAIKKMSSETFSMYSEYRRQLKSRMAMLSNEDFVFNTEAFQSFNQLYSEYSQLFSPIDNDGNLKEPGSAEYSIYRELFDFNVAMAESMSSSTSDRHQELVEYAKNNLSAEEFSIFSRKFCGPKIENTKQKEIKENSYAFNRALRQYENVIYDVDFIINNQKIIRSLYDLYESSEYALYDSNEAMSPLFYKLYNDISKAYSEEIAVELLYVNGYPNPIFNGRFSNIDLSVPSNIFSFSDDFSSEYSNPEYRDEFAMYDIYPSLSKYGNPEYESYSDSEKEFIALLVDILRDINKNNGTISMYGPVIPQVSVGFWKYVFRAGFINAIKYYAFNRDVDISNITGFNNTGRVPVALFSKYTSMLTDKRSIDRDLFKVLALAYNESAKNKAASNKMFSLHTILSSLERKKYANDYSIGKNKIYSEFGIDVNGSDVQEKDKFNFGMMFKNMMIPFTRSVQLGLNIFSFAGNAIATDAYIKSDRRFYRLKDIQDSRAYVASHVLRSIRRKLNYNKVTEDKLSTIIRSLSIKGVRAENEFRNLYGARLTKSFFDNFLYFGYTAAESIAAFPIVLGVVKNIRYVPNGYVINEIDVPPGFYNKQEFVNRFSIKGEYKATTKAFYNLKDNLFNAYVYSKDNNAWILDTKKYSEEELESALNMASLITNEVLSNATGKFNDSFNGVSSSIASLIGQNRQYIFNIINMYFTKRTYDINTRSETEGMFYSIMAGLKNLALRFTFQFSKLDKNKLESYQIENLKMFANMLMCYVSAVAVSVAVSLMANGGYLFSGDDDEDYDSFLSRVSSDILNFISASISRGATEMSAIIFVWDTIASLFKEPASTSHYGNLIDMAKDYINGEIGSEMSNPPTSSEIYDQMMIDEYGIVDDYSSDFDGQPSNKKPKKNRYGKKSGFNVDALMRNTIPGYSGVTSALNPGKRANKNLRGLTPINIYLIATDYDKKLRWNKEYRKNAARAQERFEESIYGKEPDFDIDPEW